MMNVYKFNCTVWVRGESQFEAIRELREEVDYHFGLDNNLVALQSDDGALVEEEPEEAPEAFDGGAR